MGDYLTINELMRPGIGMQTMCAHKEIAAHTCATIQIRYGLHQQGVAVVLALLLSAFAVTLVSGMFWPQHIQLRSIENQHEQQRMRSLQRDVLDKTRQILRLDAMENDGITSLDGTWAKSDAAIKLDDLLQQAESSIAALTIRVVDAQSRYNLVNLATGGKINEGQVSNYRRLLQALKIDSTLAELTATTIASTQMTGTAGENIFAFVHIDDLVTIRGYTAEILARLREFVVLLPEPTALNVNTASVVLLFAVTGSRQNTTMLAQARQQQTIRKRAEITQQSPQSDEALLIKDTFLDVKSDYFLVQQQIRLGRMSLSSEALIRRKTGGRFPDTQGRDEVLPTAVIWLRTS
ncbi:type II secretion system minor pseudopilin GspK [Undibacterium sp. Ji42W]|uniref:type II secretion system minor pseudopilin GspK n=1 Tax=Undibacterium sp. Ji42W TaxID=3413039 RepID=UPI003BF32D4F